MKVNELSIVPISEVNFTPDYLHQSHAPLYDTVDICRNYSCKLMMHETAHYMK